MYGYYSTFLDGRMTYTEWLDLSPKERDYAIESQEEIRKIKNASIPKLNGKKGSKNYED